MSLSNTDLRELSQVATTVADEAAAILLSGYRSRPRADEKGRADLVTEAKMPSAVERFSGGYSGSSRASAAGTSNAPPTACTIRAAISVASVGAAPHNADAVMNTSSPVV